MVVRGAPAIAIAAALSLAVEVFNSETGSGVGPIDFFEVDKPIELNTEVLEKWWCIGDVRNRKKVWIQGEPVKGSAYNESD